MKVNYIPNQQREQVMVNYATNQQRDSMKCMIQSNLHKGA